MVYDQIDNICEMPLYKFMLGIPQVSLAKTTRSYRWKRLMIAQDTGGAIRGTVRGDFFWGTGDRAEAAAGEMQEPGTFHILLPRTLTVPAS